MMDEAADSANSQETEEEKGGDGRERSSIGFPYIPLDDAIEVASQIQHNVGSGAMSDDQLAPALKLSPKSSGYRTRLSAARLFALIESDGGHRLSDLGKRIVDAKQERAARSDAFLNIPLYRRVYEEHKGSTIPPAAALEREFLSFGVAAKQTARARQVLERSAEQANFFEHGRDRLVKPTVKQGEESADDADKGKGSAGDSGGSGGNGGGGGTGDALLDALISKLPKSGIKWGADERVAWLTMMAMGFQITYGVEAPINITKSAAKSTEGQSGGD